MYRWAEDEDKQAVMALWAKDFDCYEPYYSWYFSAVYRPELTLCDFYDRRLISMLQLAPYTLQLRGAALPVAYMVGVITDPSWRGQGRGQALMREAHSWLEQQGYNAALLYTDIPGFYAPLGYSHCYQRQQLDLPYEQFSLLAQLANGKTDWREGSLSGDIQEINSIYKSMTARYHGYIQRNREDWKKYLGEHSCDKARLTLAEGRAYLLYTQDKEKLRIIELGFTDTPSLTEALVKAVLLATAANVERLCWPAPLDAPCLLPQIAAYLWQPTPFVMARLLNCRLVLESLACPPAALQIMTRLDIAALTRLIFGAAGALEENIGITQSERLQLTKLYPPLPGWVNEYT